MKSHKVLITGGNGALGSVLIPKLIEKKYDCMSVSRNGQNPHKIKSRKCNIENLESLEKIIQNYKPTIIIHLAGLTGNAECEKDPVIAFSYNVIGTYNILKASVKLKTKIIFASTREVYGTTKKSVKENHELNPINVNGMTKMLSEQIINNFNKLYKIPHIILRFTNFYGESVDERGISLMLKKAIRNEKITVYGGKQDLDLLYLQDAANAIMKSIQFKGSGIFNIGTGVTTNVLEILKLLEDKLNKKIKYSKGPYRKFEVKNCKINIDKAKENLKFEVSISINDVLDRMISKWSKG